MPNHVHIIIVPSDEDGLWRTFRKVHRHYAGYVNARMRVTGHLWQGRFGSVAMDEAHLVNALRYVALNPVRAQLTERAQDWQWSSTRALMEEQDTDLVTVGPSLERVGNFASFLDEQFDGDRAYAALRKAERTGRPIGSRQWLEDMQGKIGQRLIVERPGPKSRVQGLLRDCCNCHGNPFKLDDPAINMVHRPHYSPKTTLDGKFDLRKIASQVLCATTAKTN